LYLDFSFKYYTYASVNTGGIKLYKADYCLKHFKLVFYRCAEIEKDLYSSDL